MTRPNIRFAFCGADGACPAPEVAAVTLTGTGTNTALASWEAAAGDFANTYDLYVVAQGTAVDLDNVTPTYSGIEGLSQAITGLEPYTGYDVYLRVKCDADGYDDGYSPWSEAYTFRTNSNCRQPVDAGYELVSRTEARISWTNGSLESGIVSQANNFQYGYGTSEQSEVVLDAEGVTGDIAAGTATVDLDGLTPDATYWFYVANRCEDGSNSPYTLVTFTMPEACAAPANIHLESVGRYEADLAWDEGAYSTGATYELYWSTEAVDDADLDAIEPMVTGIADAAYSLTLLQRETTYHVYLRSNCGDYGISDWAEASFTTEGLGYDCSSADPITIGNGTSSTYGPVCGWYGYERHAYIYTPADGLTDGVINQLAWNYT
ncbi:MAG: hypothetical protein F083_3164, partial [bacterium F083]